MYGCKVHPGVASPKPNSCIACNVKVEMDEPRLRKQVAAEKAAKDKWDSEAWLREGLKSNQMKPKATNKKPNSVAHSHLKNFGKRNLKKSRAAVASEDTAKR